MPETYSLRSDDELEAAFEKLGVNPSDRNRSAIIKRAVLALANGETAAPLRWPIRDAKVYQVDNRDGGPTTYIINLPGTPS